MTVFMREAIGWVVIALLLGSLVFFLPWRARRTIVLQRRYPYAPGVVWDQLFADPPNLISHTTDPFDPAVKIVTFEAGFGAAKRPVVSRIRVLNEEKPVRSVTRSMTAFDSFPCSNSISVPTLPAHSVLMAFQLAFGSGVMSIVISYISDPLTTAVTFPASIFRSTTDPLRT